MVTLRFIAAALALMLVLGALAAYAHEEGPEAAEAATAHEEENDGAASPARTADLALTLKHRAFLGIVVMGTLALILVLIAMALDGDTGVHHASERLKWALFLGIIIPVLLATAYSAGTTIYLNTISESNGPVHWHADFEVWSCGEQLELEDPTGMSNRVGTTLFHEHNDNRIHVEGVVVGVADVSLHHFFETVGGELRDGMFRVPTHGGDVTALDGQLCNGRPGKVQVFVYKVTNPDERGSWDVRQRKVQDFEDYVLAPYGQVPPGDCIIVELDAEKEATERLCSSYRAAQQRGELRGG